MAPPRKKEEIPFPTWQLTVLGICRFSEPIAFNSILAYTYVMAKWLHNGDGTDASFYAGLLVSAYAVAEALTATGWGMISDSYGRKPVVLIGLGGVALSSLLFGFAKQYWVALLARFVGGALNGNVAVMQTMVAEMVKNPEHEPRAFATQPFVWFVGSIIGSAMGGFLAEPATFYPHVFPKDGIFGRYPFLLPNLVAVVVICLAIIQGIIFLEETNPIEAEDNDAIEDGDHIVDETTPILRRSSRRRSTLTHNRDVSESRTRSIRETIRSVRKRASFIEESMPLPMGAPVDIRRTSFGTMHSIKLPQEARQTFRATRPPLLRTKTPSTRQTFNYAVIMLTAACVLVSYHQMAFASILPVYILDNPTNDSGLDLVGGLGMTVHDVGAYLAVNGVLAVLIQALIFPVFVERVGVWYSFLIMIGLYPLSYVVMPFISLLRPNLVDLGIYGALILQNLFGIIAVPCLFILLKNAVPHPKVLGKVNGLAMAACCLARTISPPLVGIIYSVGGSSWTWFSLLLVSIIAAIQMFWVPRENVNKVETESAFVPRHSFQETDQESIMEEAVEDEA